MDILKPNKWLILVVATATMMADLALLFSFGALYIELMDTFRTDRASAATVQSLLAGIGLGFGVFSGALITILGLPAVTLIASILIPVGFSVSFFATSIHVLYFTIGTVSAFGMSVVQVGCVVVTGRVFKGRHQQLSITILNTSVGVASLAYPYLLSWLTEQFGLSGTFLILGGITSNTFLLFLVCLINRNSIHDEKEEHDQGTVHGEHKKAIGDEKLSKVPKNTGDKNADTTPKTIDDEKSDKFPKTINDENAYKLPRDIDFVEGERSCFKKALMRYKKLISKPYMCLVLAFACGSTTLNGYLAVKLEIALWKGFTDSEALSSFIAFNCSNIVGRFIPGLLKEIKGINIFFYPVFSAICGFCGQLLIYFSEQFAVYTVGVCLSGLAFGGLVSSSISATVRIVSSEQVPVAVGLLVSVEGILLVGVGPLFGAIRDISGSYGGVLLTTSVSQIVSALLYLSAMILRKREKKDLGKMNISSRTVYTVSDTQITYDTKL